MQPVPTAVAVAPDGSLYVGELTGVVPADLGTPGVSTGLSRVWQIGRGRAERDPPFGCMPRGVFSHEEEARVPEAYGHNFERLARIKASYDPRNVFRCNQNIRRAG